MHSQHDRMKCEGDEVTEGRMPANRLILIQGVI